MMRVVGRCSLGRQALLFAGAMALIAACDQLSLQPRPAGSTPPNAEPAPAPVDAQAQVGVTYAQFVADAGRSFAPEALGVPAADRARLWRAMASGASGEILDGGGVQALVFRGCAEEGCDGGAAVVAIDAASGEALIGVRDQGGADLLLPNDRLEALLRLRSPSGRWDQAGAP